MRRRANGPSKRLLVRITETDTVNFIDRLMPERAARRAEAALRVKQAQTRMIAEEKRAELVQAYDAARVSGRASGWSRPHTSASTEVQGALPYLRATGRDLVRNSPFAARAVRVLETHVPGTGVRPRASLTTDDVDARAAISRITRDEWDRFVENCDPSGQLDFYGQQRLMMRAVVESGEALRIWRPVSVNGALRWRCDVVESDLLDHQKNEVRSDGSRVVQGVEFDAMGRRAAYWMHDHHPGDRYHAGGLRLGGRRVPAEYVDHMYEVLRPGQVRGVSWLAPSAMILRDVDDLAEAEVVRKKLEACLAIIVHNAQDDLDTGAAVSPATDDAGAALRTAAGNPIERMQPGMVLEARPGWGVEFTAPPASAGLESHMRERLHAIAAGIGITYMQMTGDLSKANYSSMRAGDLEFRRLVDVWQDDLMVMQTGRPAWRRVMGAAQANGDLRLSVIPTAKFTPPKRPWVDPKSDAAAAIMQMRAGIESPQDVVERTGRAPEELIAELREWESQTAGLNLDPSYAKPSTTQGDDA